MSNTPPPIPPLPPDWRYGPPDPCDPWELRLVWAMYGACIGVVIGAFLLRYL